MHHLQRTMTQPQKVDMLTGFDFRCALLGSLGFSTRLITEHTGLTPGQVAYRLRLGGVRRADYRNGTSGTAAAIMRRASEMATPVVQARLREILAESRT